VIIIHFGNFTLSFTVAILTIFKASVVMPPTLYTLTLCDWHDGAHYVVIVPFLSSSRTDINIVMCYAVV